MSNVAKDICELVRKRETNYKEGATTISRYVQISMRDTLDRIDAYINSKHTSGETDSLGREKPFFNIVTAAINIWYRATDIDRKDIKIRPTKLDQTMAAFLATVHFQDWMRRENFGSFLNEWGRTLARYGSSVVKFVEQGGRLIPSVIPWNRLIVDAVQFEPNVKIEILELTEAELYERGYDKEQVEALCDAVGTRETIAGDKKDNLSEYIKLYEVHGLLPLSYLTDDDKDDYEFVQQMHVVSFVPTGKDDEYDDYTLYRGREEKDPYMITHLIKEDGQTLSIGAVQHLFEAQWMMNHTVKAMKDQLDLASKLIFQTSDGNFVGQNALTAIENGDILIHRPNEPLTQLNNSSHDITSLQAFGAQWKALANEVTGISESMKGETAPSGTPWRQIDALLQESHSLFELMTENKGIHIEEMARMYIIPHLKKKMDTSKEVSATLESYDISKVDSIYVPKEARKYVYRDLVNKILSGEQPTPMDQDMMQQSAEMGVKNSLSTLGNIRFFSPDDQPDVTWKEVLKDLEWEVEVDVTAEASAVKDDLVTLSTVLQTIADPAKAQVLRTPEGKLLFNKILTKAGGVSPLELSTLPAPSPIQQAPQPVQ